jgi:hypothetical protein
MGDFVHGPQADLKLAHEKHVHDHEHEKESHEKVVNEKDLEAGHPTAAGDLETDSAEVIKAREIQRDIKVLRKLREGEEWLDAKMGIETQGIDRIHEEDKQPPSLMNVFWLWWSMTCHVGTVPIGILGPQFGLSLGQSVAAIVVGTMLGASCTAYTGTLGPKVSKTPASPAFDMSYIG